MRLLVLTNKATHVETESLYPIVRELIAKGDEVFILDKCLDKNINFFNCQKESDIYAFKAGGSFSFLSYGNEYHNSKIISSRVFDAVLLRIDRPIENKLLEFIEKRFIEQVIVNSPRGIIDTSSKEYLFNFKNLCPEMYLCSSLQDINSFSDKFPIVLKPLKSFGGKGIYKIDKGNIYLENLKITIKEFHEQVKIVFNSGEKLLAVKFLKNIKKGDKRVLVVNRKVVGAFNRVPKTNSWLANISQGANFEESTVSHRELIMAEQLSENLEKKGITVFGFDVIKGDKMEELLSEINTLNVGGFYQVDSNGENNSIGLTVSILREYIVNKLTIKST